MRHVLSTGNDIAGRSAASDALCLRDYRTTLGYSCDEYPMALTTGAVRWNRCHADSVLPIETAITMTPRRNANALNLMFALTPVVVYSMLALGMSALLLILTATLACVLTEHLICRITGKTTTIFNSAGFSGVSFAPGEFRAFLHPSCAETPLVFPTF
jgi:hypothetical protein